MALICQDKSRILKVARTGQFSNYFLEDLRKIAFYVL